MFPEFYILFILMRYFQTRFSPKWIGTSLDNSIESIKAHSGNITSIHFNSDGSLLASGSKDRTVKLLSTDSYEIIHIFKHKSAIFDFLFNMDSSMLFVIERSFHRAELTIWSLHTNKILASFIEYSGSIFCCAISSDMKTLAYGTYKSIKLYDLVDFRIIKTINNIWKPRFIMFSTNNESLIVSNYVENYVIDVLTLSTNKKKSIIATDGSLKFFTSYSSNKDANIIATGSWMGTVDLWSFGNEKLIKCFPGPIEPVRKLSISPDGKILISIGAFNTLNIWDIESGEYLSLIDIKSGITSMDFHPTKKIIACGCYDNSIRFWRYSNI